jgi:16S rRNA (guanine527-N7)-methyltransferase
MDMLVQNTQTLFNVKLSKKQISQLQAYEDELLRVNQQFNLTAVRDQQGVRVKHFLDSFSCMLALREAPPLNLVDIGTGAGFPGIPLKILMPSLRLTLVESVGKKANFCRQIIEMLELDHVQVLQTRAEDLGQDPKHREKYDWAIARAVAAMPILMEYLLPLVRIGGRVLAQKGESGPAEAQSAENAIKLVGGRLRQVTPVHLPGVADERFLVVVDKIVCTPPGYPRRAGIPAKTPL